MHRFGILEDDQLRIVVEGDAEFLASGATIRQQASPKGRIDPGARDHFGAERRRARIQHLDLPADLARSDQPPFDEQFANGRLHHLVVTRRLGGRLWSAWSWSCS